MERTSSKREKKKKIDNKDQEKYIISFIYNGMKRLNNNV